MLTPTRTRRFQKLVTPLTQPARSSISWVNTSSSTEDQPSSHEKRLQELLEAQSEASKCQNILIQQQKKTEVDAPNSLELTTEADMKFKSDDEAYKRIDGLQVIVSRTKLAKLKINAEYIADVELNELKKFSD